MGMVATVVVGCAVIGYAAYILMGIAKKTKDGECSGCAHCPEAQHCTGKH